MKSVAMVKEDILYFIKKFLDKPNLSVSDREIAQHIKDIIDCNEISQTHFDEITFESHDTALKILNSHGYLNPNTFNGLFKLYIQGLNCGVC